MATKSLGYLLQERRSELGLTVPEVAARAGTYTRYLLRWESGGAYPTIRQFLSLEKALDTEFPNEVLRCVVQANFNKEEARIL